MHTHFSTHVKLTPPPPQWTWIGTASVTLIELRDVMLLPNAAGKPPQYCPVVRMCGFHTEPECKASVMAFFFCFFFLRCGSQLSACMAHTPNSHQNRP